MQLSDVIALIGAGYSKAEIEAMEAQDQIDNPDQAPAAPQPSPVQPDPAQPESAPAHDPELLAAIKQLTAAVQHNNVINSQQPAGIVPEDVQQEADKLLTQFCNT